MVDWKANKAIQELLHSPHGASHGKCHLVGFKQPQCSSGFSSVKQLEIKKQSIIESQYTDVMQCLYLMWSIVQRVSEVRKMISYF